tara:strand:+ start:224 stop:682 length:459 start_codon:yes stop_codon:yes gene_type:complete
MSAESLPRNKILRDKLINHLLDRCNKSKIKNRTLGAWVKAWHYSAPFGGLFAIMICSKLFATGALIGVTLAGIFAVYFNGCFLSLLEYKLTGDKTDNITNIFLEAFNCEVNKKNQTKLTYFVLCTYLPFVYLIYYFRFYYKAKPLVIPNITN